ncbi:Uridine/cytidine kinase [endosymbiont GvMRE of Glomus versiforme]|nr:Uridine/cytidine kinase [endosymbiont GvMRE of Glomus versiforme]
MCQGILQYPFLANYEQGRFVCTECLKERREEVIKSVNINCLYFHFKNTPKKIKIVCDWDEVIQPLEPKAYYELSEWEGAYYSAPWWMPNGTKFEEWFKNFWLNPPIYYSDYGSHSVYSEKSMIKSCVMEENSFALGARNIKDKIDKIKNEPDFYEHSPFLTIAKELLMLVKEAKIEIIFLSAYDEKIFKNGDPRKKKIFSETFGKFANCSLNLIGFDSEKTGKTKSEWIKENVPDCNVVIDDNPNILTKVLEDNPQVNAFAPWYPSIKHHEKVLLIKTSISVWKKMILKVNLDNLRRRFLIINIIFFPFSKNKANNSANEK